MHIQDFKSKLSRFYTPELQLSDKVHCGEGPEILTTSMSKLCWNLHTWALPATAVIKRTSFGPSSTTPQPLSHRTVAGRLCAYKISYLSTFIQKLLVNTIRRYLQGMQACICTVSFLLELFHALHKPACKICDVTKLKGEWFCQSFLCPFC